MNLSVPLRTPLMADQHRPYEVTPRKNHPPPSSASEHFTEKWRPAGWGGDTSTEVIATHRNGDDVLQEEFSTDNGKDGKFANVLDLLKEREVKYPDGGTTIINRAMDPAILPINAEGNPDSRMRLTHGDLLKFLEDDFDLAQFGLGRGDRVCVLIDNGPELALCVMGTTTYCTAVPINPQGSVEEIQLEMSNTQAKGVIFSPKHPHVVAAAEACYDHAKRTNHVQVVIELHPSVGPKGKVGLFSLQRCAYFKSPIKIGPTMLEDKQPNVLDDYAMILHTSGTSGTKKIVPYPLKNILVGAYLIQESWGLRQWDLNLNIMPLFHIGGIARNVFAPMISGGQAVYAPGFDPEVFWDIGAAGIAATWYYASPTMHQMILDVYNERKNTYKEDPSVKFNWSTLRFIANAAGGLLPELAISMKAAYDMPDKGRRCVILPSYGMTECMPNTSPPQDYQLDRPGCSGIPVGPDIALLDGNGQLWNRINTQEVQDLEIQLKKMALDDPRRDGMQRQLDALCVGEICVRGCPVFPGYLQLPRERWQRLDDKTIADNSLKGDDCFKKGDETDCFVNPDDLPHKRWFMTGDCGRIDEAGFLYITGRNKEVINRGGEIISPFEIESAVTKIFGADGDGLDLFAECMAFSVSHDTLQETVGLAVRPKPNRQRPSLETVVKKLGQVLHSSKWPHCLVYMPEGIPKTAGTKKVQRIKFWERCLTSVHSDDAQVTEDLFLTSSIGLSVGTRKIPHTLTDKHTALERTFEATVPPESMGDLKMGIKLVPISDTFGALEVASMMLMPPFAPEITDVHCKYVETAPKLGMKPTKAKLTAYTKPDWVPVPQIKEWIKHSHIHEYMWPTEIVPFDFSRDDKTGNIANEQDLPEPELGEDFVPPSSSTAALIAEAVEDLLGVSSVSTTVNFFELGVTSLLAGKLAAGIRKRTGAGCSVAEVFRYPTIQSLAEFIEAKLVDSKVADEIIFEYPDAERSNGVTAMLVQLIPMVIVYPIVRITNDIFFILIFVPMCGEKKIWNEERTSFYVERKMERVPAFIITFLILWVIRAIVWPSFGILCKWLITCGRIRKGVYPMFGQYYLRWWTTNQILSICGRGAFLWTAGLLRLYYRLLGAKIGANVAIAKGAVITEPDLVEIGDNCFIDSCEIKPFHMDHGCMLLENISMGNNVSICTKATVVPGQHMSGNSVLSPNSASYDLASMKREYGNYCRPAFRMPSWKLRCLVGYPMIALVHFLAWVPVLIILIAMLESDFYKNFVMTSLSVVFDWFMVAERIAFYYLLRTTHTIVSPWVYFFCCLCIKWTVVGKFREGPRNISDWNIFRHWLMAELLPGQDLGGITKMIGTHYELVSIMYRILGAKVGARVYWPGSGIEIVETDLLTVQDDVVFGSRSVMMPCDNYEAKPIRIGKAAMLADRCVVLPGVTLDTGTILGSGSLAAKNGFFDKCSIWVGNKDGNAMKLEDGSPEEIAALEACSVRPFGRAFYQHWKCNIEDPVIQRSYEEKPIPYWVMPLWLHVVFNTCNLIFGVLFRSSPMIFSLYFIHEVFVKKQPVRPDSFWIPLAYSVFIVMHTGFLIASFGIDVAAKWIIMGRRTCAASHCAHENFDKIMLHGKLIEILGCDEKVPLNAHGIPVRSLKHTWDETSYCQRWQLYLNVCAITRIMGPPGMPQGLLNFMQGSLYICWYFRSLGSTIGDNVCLYPAGADPMMTEPDLTTIGDGACVDNASLICHINTRGKFELNHLIVSEKATLRTGSRLLSGAKMDPKSTLLEHSMLLGGDTADSGCYVQGWPGLIVDNPRTFVSHLMRDDDRDATKITIDNRSRSSSRSGGSPLGVHSRTRKQPGSLWEPADRLLEDTSPSSLGAMFGLKSSRLTAPNWATPDQFARLLSHHDSESL